MPIRKQIPPPKIKTRRNLIIVQVDCKVMIVKDLIDNQRFQTIVDYILLAWKASPNLQKREMLNVKTIMYLNKKGKNAAECALLVT